MFSSTVIIAQKQCIYSKQIHSIIPNICAMYIHTSLIVEGGGIHSDSSSFKLEFPFFLFFLLGHPTFITEASTVVFSAIHLNPSKNFIYNEIFSSQHILFNIFKLSIE